MKEYVLAMIFDNGFENVLMIKRNKEPFIDMCNGIGGKIEAGESTKDAILREVEEETEIVEGDIDEINFLVKLIFDKQPSLNVFYIKMKKSFSRVKFNDISEGSISWLNIKNHKLLDVNNKNLAGDGNLQYFIKYVLNREGVLNG